MEKPLTDVWPSYRGTVSMIRYGTGDRQRMSSWNNQAEQQTTDFYTPLFGHNTDFNLEV